jgi:hypothetical protein
MRDARRDLPLPDSASGVASPEQNPRSAIGSDSFSTDYAENIAATGAIRSIGYKLSLQRGPNFREGTGNGLRLRGLSGTTATTIKENLNRKKPQL